MNLIFKDIVEGKFSIKSMYFTLIHFRIFLKSASIIYHIKLNDNLEIKLITGNDAQIDSYQLIKWLKDDPELKWGTMIILKHGY